MLRLRSYRGHRDSESFLKKNLLQFIMVVGGSVAISRSPFIIGQVVAAILVLGQTQFKIYGYISYARKKVKDF